MPFKSQNERDVESKESYLNFKTDLQEQNAAKPTTENYLRYQSLGEVGMVLKQKALWMVFRRIPAIFSLNKSSEYKPASELYLGRLLIQSSGNVILINQIKKGLKHKPLVEN